MTSKKQAKSKSKHALPMIEIDGGGVAWVRGKQVKVVEIVLDKLAHGGSVKEIRSRFPKLTQKQIGAALDYFRDHQDEFQAEIQRIGQHLRQLGVREEDSPFQRRLRELSKGGK